MKTKAITLAIAVLALVLAAGWPVSGLAGKQEKMPGHEAVFAEAEALFASGNVEAARKAYRGYLARFPQESMASAAWMRIAQIAAKKKDYTAQREACKAVYGLYPASSYADDARLACLESYLAEGRPDLLMQEAKDLIARMDKDKIRASAYAVVGDGYMQAQKWDQAFLAYSQAHTFAAPDKKAALAPRLEKAAQELDFEKTQDLAAEVHAPVPLGFLLARLAKFQAGDGDWDLAASTLERFQKTCPGHPLSRAALDLEALVAKKAVWHADTVACLLPLSGPYGVFGQRILQGVELAATQYNTAHPDQPVNIVVQDSLGTDTGAREGYLKLVDQGVAAVIGPTVGAEALKDTAREEKIPAVVFTQKEGATGPGSYLLRNFATPSMQAAALVRYAMENLGLRRFAVLHPRDTYGKTFMERFWDAVVASGGTIAGVESYDPGQTDIQEPIRKLISQNRDPAKPKQKPAADFEAVFIPDTPAQAGLVIPQLRYCGVSGVLAMGTNLWHSPKLLEVGGPYARGAVMPDVFCKDGTDPEVRDFVSAFEAAYGPSPDYWAALGYDTANMIFMAARLSGVRSGKTLRNALVQWKDFTGVTGKSSFDDTGEPGKEMIILRLGPQGFEHVP